MKLEIKDIHKSFDGNEVLHGVHFSVESGKALGLLGRNGAGKTTTIRILMDVFKANSGSISMDGKPFHPKEYKIGYLPEERGLYPKKKVREQLLYLAQLRGVSYKEASASLKHWLKRLGIEEYENRRLDTLSKGNQQKVQLAQTLLADPDIVILDEPFSGLDPVNSQILKDVVLELIQDHKLVIFSSHQMSYVEEFCEDIAIMNHGSIVLSGGLKEIKRSYGQNRLVLQLAGKTPDMAAKICREELLNYVSVYEKQKDRVILELQEGRTKAELLEAIVKAKLDVEAFMDYEPSLTDIFVWKAGDEA